MAIRHLLDSWEEVKKDLANRSLYLFLDYDGTLSPIVRNPEKAVLSRLMRQRLEEILKIDRCRISVISGRSLEDIRKRVAIGGIIYAGNHGLEMDGPGVKFKYPIPRKIKRSIGYARGMVEKSLSGIPGVLIEEKGVTLTVHLRRVKRGELLIAAHDIMEATQSYRLRGDIVIRLGKEVFEIRPAVEWNKGKSVAWLLEKSTAADGEAPWPICIGDDRTDEDIFREIGKRGVTVFVGTPGQTKARYYLRNVGEVSSFLARLAGVRKG